MKLELLFVALFAMPGWLSAQQVVVSPLDEKTINRFQYGGSVSIEVPSQWRFGGFYQTSIFNREQIGHREHFWGMTVYVPLVKTDRITFYGNARIGVVNRYFIVACPAVATELKILTRLYLTMGMGIRKGYLSAQTSLSLKL